MTRLVLLAVALFVALLVGVAYAIVYVPSSASITGNTITAASLADAACAGTAEVPEDVYSNDGRTVTGIIIVCVSE
ncbi:hypothetical protein LCGC14_2232840 [marine sediment metagenome]|uniref:Uncharacterized protein n=1 Tax=marine sediment metagenome TaxID=412755 RepID=A0A0F9D7G6_9ZZZZ